MIRKQDSSVRLFAESFIGTAISWKTSHSPPIVPTSHAGIYLQQNAGSSLPALKASDGAFPQRLLNFNFSASN